MNITTPHPTLRILTLAIACGAAALIPLALASCGDSSNNYKKALTPSYEKSVEKTGGDHNGDNHSKEPESDDLPD